MARKNYDAAATLIVNTGEAITLRYGMQQPNVGVGVDTDTNRLTFDPRITLITVVDAGGVESTRRKLPRIGRGIEVGVPPQTSYPTTSIRVEFKDLTGKPATVYGLKGD